MHYGLVVYTSIKIIFQWIADFSFKITIMNGFVSLLTQIKRITSDVKYI